MIKNLLTVMLVILAATSCTKTNATPGKSRAKARAEAPVSAVADTALMITQEIPAGSAKVLVHTTEGDFTVLLYGDTPRHRDNFLRLVREGEYDGVLFHRVIKDFMVQTGDPDSKDAPAGRTLGSGDIGERLPAEIVFPRHYHKRGALAAARLGDAVNPERMSSGSQFYVVTGRVFSEPQLQQMSAQLRQSVGQNHFNQLAQAHMSEIQQMQRDGDREGLSRLQEQLSVETNEWLAANPVAYTPEMIKVYTTIGGTPHLDNEYTVFGEVISGMDTIDRIQHAATGAADRPLEDIRIVSAEVVE